MKPILVYHIDGSLSHRVLPSPLLKEGISLNSILVKCNRQAI